MRCKGLQTLLAAFVWGVALLAGSAAQAQDGFQKGLDAYLDGEYRKALQHWRPAAESGNAVAAFNIGVLYAQGLGVEADPAEAVRWYRRSAHAGYPNAQFNLGAAYYHGEGAEENISQAVSWWERAAEQDHPEALYNLGALYRRGKGVPRNIRRAVSLFEKAAALGDARARQALADMDAPAAERAGDAAAAPQPGDGGAGGPNPLAAENPEHWTVQLFAGTEEQAATRFARENELGGHLRIYRAKVNGRTWFKGIYGSFADRAGAQAAQAKLARELPGSDPWIRSFRAVQLEAVGPDLVQDATAGTEPGGPQAARQQASAAEREAASPATDGAGDAPAPGTADSGNPDEADQAEEAGEAAAASASGPEPQSGGERAALRRGQKAFNAQDYAEAFAAWRPLAEKGVPEAQYGVGFMYERGQGVERDYGKAFRWYQRAAQQGHVEAQYNLGMLYRNGQGVAQNDALGLYWIQTAADRGDERARSYLKELN